MEDQKPPLGIMPRPIWLDVIVRSRCLELLNAMKRYVEAGKKIPVEWIEELKALPLGNKKESEE